jgi:hypothetical protein
MTTLPPARRNPCGDCPWRRNAIPGWLGPHDAETWVAMAHSDVAIACHTTINPVVSEEEAWDDPDILQCAGAATYRSNVCKSPRDPQVVTKPANHETVFSRPNEFLEFHQGGPRG